MEHGLGKAMLMRGGACAAELRLMGVWVGSGCRGVCRVCGMSLCASFFILCVVDVLCCVLLDLRLCVLAVPLLMCVRGDRFLCLICGSCWL